MSRVFLTFAALLLPLPAAALDLEALSAAQRDAFRAEVRAYLLDNPEVLLEAIAVLEERQAGDQAADDAALVAANADALFAGTHSWVGGNPDGDATVVEFVDYNCGFCKRAFGEVMALVEADPGVRLVMKELPILGPDSELASRFAIAVLQLEGAAAYEEVHGRLLSMPGRAGAPAVQRIGAEMDLDMAAIEARMQSPEVGAVIDANRALAARMGINGTPTFVIGGQVVRGYVPLSAMQQLVAEGRQEG
ncbi:DsbA family protein [Rhodobaculum claviforme]|uniref:Disulfide bond formation protein DsbA n=1 Tax=Rhodobaculum claviforme TaxID=1549854 RepID=A0A934TM47_9RHOB|nr:DsbA family protein [Rhodobaculum claviforme]MBK5928074.1 disulfide bond formation protein DsbA [Rhodobaculum claviforme]